MSSTEAAAAAAPAAATSAAAGAGAADLNPAVQPQYTPDGLIVIGCEDMPAGTPIVKGYEFDKGVDFDGLMASFRTMGFQATNVALAADEIEKMLKWRLSDEEIKPSESEEWKDPAVRANHKCTIWLAFTSNMISSGQREIIHYLAKHRMVSAIVTTAGAVEEDVMKTLRPHYIGDFEKHPGASLRMRGINRTGNLLVPNLNYVALEEWFIPVLNRMHDEQDDRKRKPRQIWSPSKIIQRMGEEMKDETSVWYWTARNNIPVFCPSLTDGAIGDMLFYHSYEREGFIVDIAQDVRRINNIARRAKRSGMIVLGGGVVKHHTCNANLMRNGADYAVFINTGHEYDGSDTGARPDEAVSWGKIKMTATPVKIYAEATLVFPLLVAQTFAKHHAAARAKAIADGKDGSALDAFAAPAERADDPE